MDGLPALSRLVHFLGLRGFPARLERWLARDRCVAVADVLARLEPRRENAASAFGPAKPGRMAKEDVPA
jgi:hypothetical protein